jgi:hypothetical protein
MRFLLRTAFWLGIVLLLLPSLGAMSGSGTPKAPAIGAADAASAAFATVSDLRQFCTRQPDACAIGAQVGIALGQKAQAGAKMLYEFLSETLASTETDTAAREKAAAAKGSQHTLSQGDLAPEWRGTAKPRDAQTRRMLGDV